MDIVVCRGRGGLRNVLGNFNQIVNLRNVNFKKGHPLWIRACVIISFFLVKSTLIDFHKTQSHNSSLNQCSRSSVKYMSG